MPYANDVLVEVLNIGKVVAVLAPIALDLAAKLKGLLELSPDMQVNIRNLATFELQQDDETKSLIEKWRQENLPQPPPQSL